MRKFGLFAVTAVTAVTLAGFGGWVAATPQVRIAAPVNGPQIDALQIMTVSGNLPTQHLVDYSLVFPGE
jgi:hypothetical protein